MPYVERDGVRIHYRVEGSGVPLVLHHGFTSRLDRWYENGYVEALQDRYRLILIDARGHGKSDKPHDPAAYQTERRVADVLAVMDAVGIERAHFFGYSMGGLIGFALARQAPDRLRSLILGGAHAYLPESDPRLLAGGGLGGWRSERDGDWLRRNVMYRLRRWKWRFINHNDLDAALAFAQSGPVDVDLGNVLPTMTMPCFLFVGEHDVPFRAALVERCADEMPNATYLMLPGRDHDDAMRADGLLTRITGFLESAEREVGVTT